MPLRSDIDGSTTYPTARRAWGLVAILLIAYAVSFVDRQILSLLVQDLRRDLAISDAQIGLLQGPAFGLFYAVMGLPFGWLADRVSRTRLIAAGLLLWTVMTLLGGVANGFGPLFLTRMGVGVGEAALVPAAVSLLADSFAPHRRALPLATFTAGVSVGAGMALILGGGLIAFAQDGAADLPSIGAWLAGRAPWQIVLILAGLAGVPLAAVIGLIPDPARSARTLGDGASSEPLFDYIRRHRALFGQFLGGSSLLYLFSNAFAGWMPAMFIRGFGWEPAMVGVRVGALVLTGALAGNLSSGIIATRLARSGRPDGTMRTMVGGAMLLAPFAILGPLAGDPRVAQAAVLLIYFAIAWCFGVATASFVAITPSLLRGRMVALYLMLGNLVGLGLGPPAVGLVLERGIGDERQVGVALAIVAAPSVLFGAWLLRRALRLHAPRAAALAG